MGRQPQLRANHSVRHHQRKACSVRNARPLLPYSVPMGLLALGLLVAACEPTVRLEAPRDPVTINLNVNLDADVRVRLEETAREDIQANPDIF